MYFVSCWLVLQKEGAQCERFKSKRSECHVRLLGRCKLGALEIKVEILCAAALLMSICGEGISETASHPYKHLYKTSLLKEIL